MSTPVIPPPEGGFRIVSGAARTMLVVDTDHAAVLLSSDGLAVTVSIDEEQGSFAAADTDALERSVRDWTIPGRVVASVPLDCAGPLRDEIHVSGSGDDQRLAREAITHLYPHLREPADRAGTRAIYRRLRANLD